MEKTIITIFTALALILSVGFFIPAHAREAQPVPLYSDGVGFDKADCEQECRSRFGVDFYSLHFWGGGWDQGRYRLYARCIQECNRRFWREFDRETDIE